MEPLFRSVIEAVGYMYIFYENHDMAKKWAEGERLWTKEVKERLKRIDPSFSQAWGEVWDEQSFRSHTNIDAQLSSLYGNPETHRAHLYIGGHTDTDWFLEQSRKLTLLATLALKISVKPYANKVGDGWLKRFVTLESSLQDLAYPIPGTKGLKVKILE
jgi:hypothetical protein